MSEWWNWQTRQTQNLIWETMCGFKSHFRHQGTDLSQYFFWAYTQQTESKIIRDNIQGESNANNIHYEVGKKVRQTIKDIGGIMPEDLPTLKKSLKELEKEKKEALRIDN